jgi:hypothetical protein
MTAFRSKYPVSLMPLLNAATSGSSSLQRNEYMQDNSSGGAPPRLLLFVAGLGAGGFLISLLFAIAVSAGVHLA